LLKYVAGPLALQAAEVVSGVNVLNLAVFAVTAIFGPAGFLFSGLGRLITQGLIYAVTANLFVWLLDKIGNTVGDVTAKIVTYPFEATPKGLLELRKKLNSEDDVVFVRLVNTLLDLDFISVQEKVHIRKVVGLGEGELLQPLTVLSKDDEKHQHEV